MTIAIIVAILGLIVILYIRHRRHIIVAAPVSTGVQIRKAAENIPIYGTFVKAAGVVGKPINTGLRKWTDLQVSAIKHIPVVGGVAAKPLELVGGGVNKLNNWLGL